MRANNVLLPFTLVDFRLDQKVRFLENLKGIVIPLSAATDVALHLSQPR
jgi:hypothetical protein